MLEELVKEISELKECKKRCEFIDRDRQYMSNLLYEYMIKEYESMSRQDILNEYKKEYCDYCRRKGWCRVGFPDDIYKPVPSDIAWVPGRITCGNFEWL